jgi:hypothetical protein
MHHSFASKVGAKKDNGRVDFEDGWLIKIQLHNLG